MNRKLVILLIGRILTNFADSFYMIAAIWYVKTVTESPFLIGVTSAVAILPVTIQFIYGPLIDRFSKRKILVTAMMGQALFVSLISILYFSHLLWIPLLFVLLFMALSFSEMTYPTESALIERLAEKGKLTKVNSIFSFSYQTLDILCDAVSGLLIAFVGLGIIFVSNSLILIFTALLFLLFLKIPRSKKETDKSTLGFIKQYKEDFREGLIVVKQKRRLLHLLFGIIGMNVMATMGLAMLPVISETPAQYGFWLTAMSVGTLSGTILSSRVEHFPLNRILPIASLWSGVFWLTAFTLTEIPILPYLLFGTSWVGIGILSIYVQTMIQVNLPRDHIGIGFAFISSLLGSLSPLGYLLGGMMGEITSGMLLLSLSGLGYLLFAIYFLMNPLLKKLNDPLSVIFEITS
ncbi:MFS transporter [Rossellomorea vietnamensis]|uniref:MFS transporter n=1 Tax=Rossellomorea vietnamensis TaxID=218284 RepID=A0A5D4MB87_9BACI|nr:MFS transporter [Rossellomorea vietnamensis]TYR99219.1 MFS transporter [Rossellomorea vietnamensis]